MIIEELRLAEIGLRTGSKVFILPLSCALGLENLTVPSPTALVELKETPTEAPTTNNDDSETKDLLNEEKDRTKTDSFRRSIRARLTVLQVINAIRGQTLFSFDFLLLTILASIIASLGLLEDNSV